MNLLDTQNQKQMFRPTRPAWLTFLCVLSFIGSGLTGFSFLLIYLSYDEAIPMILEFGGVIPGVELFATAGRGFFLTGFILFFLSFFGVSLIWRMRKAGFHFYAASQIMALFLPVIYIKDFPFQFTEAIITALFIFFYSRFLKLMI
jgi:hypothetical protein